MNSKLENYIPRYLHDCEYCWNKNYLKTLYRLYEKIYKEVEEDEK